MKKRLLIMLVALVGMTLQSIGQNFTVTMPKFEKIVTVTGDRVNLRSKSNVKSNRVGVVEKGQALAVIREDGDWYEVFCNLEPEEYISKTGYLAEAQMGHSGYVMKKFCQEIVLSDASGYEVIEKGSYAGVCIDQENVGLVPGLWVGKKVGNFCVFDHWIAYEDIKTSVHRDKYSVFDFSKMSDQDIANIIRQTAVPEGGASFIVFREKGKTGEMRIYYNPKDDIGLIKMVTK